VSAELIVEGLTERPLYFVSSNSHSLVNIVSGVAQEREPELIEFVEQLDDDDILRQELMAFRAGESQGSWENFLYFVARLYFSAGGPEAAAERRALEQQRGVTHLRSKTALRVPAQVISLGALDPKALDPRLGRVDADALAASGAVIVNIDYPLGMAAYHHLSAVALGVDELRGIYVMGKAATLNGRVGDVMISKAEQDEHSSNTYLFKNALTAADVQPFMRHGTVLDNQKALTVRSAFLQNREYMDVFYREGYTVMEMEAGPYLSAAYEMAEPRRHPKDELVSLVEATSFDFGVIHYASDTPYSRRQSLLSKSLSYFGMESTYGCAVAIARRNIKKEIARLG
jgi:hypothetical protein